MAGVTQDLLPHNGDKVKAILAGLLDMVHDLARTSAVRSEKLSTIEQRVQSLRAEITALSLLFLLVPAFVLATPPMPYEVVVVRVDAGVTAVKVGDTCTVDSSKHSVIFLPHDELRIDGQPLSIGREARHCPAGIVVKRK